MSRHQLSNLILSTICLAALAMELQGCRQHSRSSELREVVGRGTPFSPEDPNFVLYSLLPLAALPSKDALVYLHLCAGVPSRDCRPLESARPAITKMKIGELMGTIAQNHLGLTRGQLLGVEFTREYLEFAKIDGEQRIKFQQLVDIREAIFSKKEMVLDRRDPLYTEILRTFYATIPEGESSLWRWHDPEQAKTLEWILYPNVTKSYANLPRFCRLKGYRTPRLEDFRCDQMLMSTCTPPAKSNRFFKEHFLPSPVGKKILELNRRGTIAAAIRRALGTAKPIRDGAGWLTIFSAAEKGPYIIEIPQRQTLGYIRSVGYDPLYVEKPALCVKDI